MIRTEEYGMPNLGIGEVKKNEEKDKDRNMLYQKPLTFTIRLTTNELVGCGKAN